MLLDHLLGGEHLAAAQFLGALLQTFGHDVTVMEDAASAIAARNTSLAVFIPDIGLFGIDGNELVRRLRADPTSANAVKIALTEYGQAHDRVLTKAAGFDRHFVKPVTQSN